MAKGKKSNISKEEKNALQAEWGLLYDAAKQMKNKNERDQRITKITAEYNAKLAKLVNEFLIILILIILFVIVLKLVFKNNQ